MKNMRPVQSSSALLIVCLVSVAGLLSLLPSPCRAAADTVIVTAEGLADPDSDIVRKDGSALGELLLNDAKKQAIEKVVGLYMDNPLLVENYRAIDTTVLADDTGLVKAVLQKSEPWQGGDGFMHILIRAEIYGARVESALREMGKNQRTSLIRQAGNPRITVAITVRDSERDSAIEPERSAIAENILKEHIAAFGYRVWTEDAAGQPGTAANSPAGRAADFAIRGEVKFKPVNLKLKTSGIEINKITITSWTVKCIDTSTGEEIYFNNKIPARKSWSTEDMALQAVGELIGGEFSREFFEQHLLQRTGMYQLVVQGLPSYDTAILFKKELIGLRPVLNVDLRTFDKDEGAIYEVEFSTGDLDFSEVLNDSILKPLNKKFGEPAFSLSSIRNRLIKILFRGSGRPRDVVSRFEETPPSSLADASPVRLNQVAATRGTLEKVGEINPQGAAAVMEHRRSGGKTSLEAIKNF